jgi:3-deoxy-7-phosphoheptulonate synthase
MLVTLSGGADVAAVGRALTARGLWTQRLDGAGAPAFWIQPGSRKIARGELLDIPGVAAVAETPSAHPRVDAHPPTVVCGRIPVEIGGPRPVFMAGPCSVESAAHAQEIAGRLAALGVQFLRGGAWKPRTSPYAFQGHGAKALEWMRDAADAAGMNVVTELLAPEEAALVGEAADLVQIGSRSMHVAPLLHAAGRTGKPVLLKRGMSATIEEWLGAAEYCLLAGAPAVVFCERGVRGFDPATRNLLDLGAVALLAHAHRLPVIVDPSHALGRRDLVRPLAAAALAAGAAGLLIEVHDAPERALSDGPQALSSSELSALIEEVTPS